MKISRNDYCPCGSGKKYKNCHFGKEDPVIVQKSRQSPSQKVIWDDLDPAKANVMSPEYWEKMSKQLPPDMRKEFEPMIRQARQYAEFESRREQIEAAGRALEVHHSEYKKLTQNTAEWLRRAEQLFAEDPFVDMRVSAADVQRAFETVGYPLPGSTGTTFTEIVDKAICFLLDDAQRATLAQRLLLTLPDYVKAGRYLDGWIIQHSANLTAESRKDVTGPFLLAMFLHGLREWDAHREQEQLAIFKELGTSTEEIRAMGYDGIEAWLRDMRGKPDKAEMMEKFLASHPELHAMTQAQCEAADEAAGELLRREDAGFLLLTSEELEPWLAVLNHRLASAPEGFASLPRGRKPDEAIDRAFMTIFYDLASEMAETIFIPARFDQLKAQLRQLRSRFVAEDDHDGIAGIHGALMGLQAETPHQDRHFLTSLCVESLRAEMDAMFAASKGAKDGQGEAGG